jgi:hypothetical protein
MMNLINLHDSAINGRRGLVNPNVINYMYNNKARTPTMDNISPGCYLYGEPSDSFATLGNLHCLNLFGNSPVSLNGSMQMLLGSPLYPYQGKKINNTTFSDAVKNYGYKM